MSPGPSCVSGPRSSPPGPLGLEPWLRKPRLGSRSKPTRAASGSTGSALLCEARRAWDDHRMSFLDWALAVHVLSAFAYVAGLVLFWVLVVAVRRVDTPEQTLRMEPIVKVGNVAVGAGAIGTIVIGIYLAFAVDSYAIWDGWIIAALVLWAVAGGLGQRTGVAYMQGMNKAKELDAAGRAGPDQELLALNRTQAGLILQTLASLAVLLILADMIFKPGA